MKKSLLLTMLLAFALPWTALANELTLSDGTTDNSYVPVYGLYVDEFIHTQIIYPASSLTEMTGEEIHSMRFYLKSPASASWGNAHFEIRLSEVSAASFSSAAWNTENAGVLVYSGALDGTGEEMNVVFTTSFTYNGGNLLFDLVNTTKGTYKSASFYGVSTTGASVSGNNSSDVTKATASLRNFLPKTTFDYGAPPTCIKPTGLAVSLTPGDGSVATLSWTAGADEAAWQICLNDDEDNLVEAGSNPFELTGLTPEQAYTAKVRAYCGEEQSAWSSAVSFTPSNAYSVTLNDGTATNSYVPVYGSYSDYGNRSQFILSSSELSSLQWAHLKKLTFFNNTVPAKDFAGAVFEVYLKEVTNTTFASEAFEDWNSMTEVYDGALVWDGAKLVFAFDDAVDFQYQGGNLLIGLSETAYASSSTYTSTSWLGESQGSGVYAAIYQNAGSNHTYSNTPSRQNFLPKVTIDYIPGEAPSCLPVSELVVSDIQAHSAVLDWTAGQSESAWKLYYKKAAEEGWSAAIDVNALPYTLENLDAATSYQFKVVAVCSDSDESDASAVASFNTGYAAPFEEKFNASSAPANWAIYSGLLAEVMSGGAELTSASGWNFGAGNNVFDSHAKANIYGTSSNKWLVTPAIEVGENMQLSFDLALTMYSSSSSPTAGEQDDDKFVVLISTDNKQSWSVLRQWDNAGSEYVYDAITNAAEGQFVNIDLSEYAGKGVVIAFYGESTLEGGDNNLHIDNVAIKEIPSCLKPTDLAVDNIGAHSAQLRWSANSGESAWKLFVKKVSEADFAEAVVVEENPYILESLDAATSYQFKVVAVCGEENESEESAVASFITDCEALTIDADHSYQMNFDALTVASSYTAPSSRVLPVCWNAINTTTYSSNQVFPTAYYYSYTNYANSAPNSLKFYSSYSSYGSYDPQPQYAILPEMEGLDGKQISLSARGYNASSEIKIGRMSDPADASTFVPFATQALTTSYQEFEFIVPSGEGNYLAIMIEAANSSRTNNGAYIDDIVVSVAPTCAKPKNPVRNYSSIKAHSVELSWTAGDESQTAWEIALSKCSSFNPDETDSIVAVTSNPATINQYLDQNTTYYAYVRANCGSEDGKSLWSSSYVSFTTISGHQTLNSLALVDGSLGSASAKVNWKSNAANERHSSYEVYISQQNTLPATEEELSSDGLILNIEDTFYVFNNLESETQYYVWVRDNCGEDGLSEWSSRATFTTTANCPIPAGISASEIAAHTADIAWTIGEADGYTVQYRTAAGMNGTEEAFASSSIPSGWENKSGLLANVMGGTALSSGSKWSFGTSDGVFDSHSKINIYGTSCYGWLISPSVAIVEGAVLNFDLALTAYSYSGTLVAPGTNGTDDRFIVLISTDDEATWSILREWNNSGSGYVYNDIASSATGENVNIDLDSYKGQNVRIAFYGESTSSNADNDLHIDNVAIGIAIPAGAWASVDAESGERLAHLSGLAPETKYEVQVKASCGEEFSESIYFTTEPSCFAPSAVVVSEISAHTAKLAWTNGAEGQEAWQIMLNGDEEHLIDVNANPFVVEGLEAATAYSVKVRANCGDEDGVSAWSAAINFTTDVACPAPTALAANNIAVHSADLAWTGSVDVASYDIRYRTAEGLNALFFEGFEDGIGQWTMQDCASSTGVSTDASYIHSGNGAFSFVYNTTPPQYLISPEISSVVDGMKLEFYYKNTSSSWAETFHVGFSSTDNATASFEFGEEITASDQQWHLYSEEIPAGTKYICWKLTSNDKLRLCIDDITIGTPVAAGEWQVASSHEASLSLENLAAGTKYDVQVKSACSEDAWTEVLNFTTLNNSVSISDAGYATYYNLTDAYIMPEGVVGHVFSVASGLQLAYESGAVVPADVPLVLEGEEGDYVLLAAEGGASTELANQLIGVNEASTIAEEDGYLFYVLSLNAAEEVESVGFYWMNETGAGGFDMPAHKAYLKVAKLAEAPAPRFYLFHGENNATWLNNLQGVDGTVKFFHNGHFYIMRDHVIYDATGKRVELKYN